MTVAPAGSVRIHRAPRLDPPFDDELHPTTYRPARAEPAEAVPPQAVAGASPECHTAAHRFLNLCLELFNGFRAPSQLRPLLRVTEAHDLLEELARALRRLALLRRTAPAGTTHQPVRRRQLRTCEPRTGVAEVAAVLSDGRTTWSLAYRLERDGTTWRCTALTVLL